MMYGINANLTAYSPTMYDLTGPWPGADLGQSNLWGFNGIGTLAGAWATTGELSAGTPWLQVGQSTIAYGDTTYTHAATGQVGLFDFNYNFLDNSHTPIYEYEKQKAGIYNVDIQIGAQYADLNTQIGVFAEASFNSPVLLDLDGKGTQPGLLVFDADQNGDIAANELMNETGIDGEANRFRNGWEKALALADVDHNYNLTGNELTGFSVWVDGDGDGASTACELKSLGDLDISEIDPWEGSFTRRREVGAIDVTDGHVYSAMPGPNNSSVFPGEPAPRVYTPGPFTPAGTAAPGSDPTPTAAAAASGRYSGLGMGRVDAAGANLKQQAAGGNKPPETPPSNPPPSNPPTPPSEIPTVPPPTPLPDPGENPTPPPIPVPGPYPGDPGAPIPYPYPGIPSITFPGSYPNPPNIAIPGGYPFTPNIGIPGGYPFGPGLAIPWPYPGGFGLPIPGGYPMGPVATIPWNYPYPV